jgi:pimeloyl-ACP methyl ester carboxylesterase
VAKFGESLGNLDHHSFRPARIQPWQHLQYFPRSLIHLDLLAKQTHEPALTRFAAIGEITELSVATITRNDGIELAYDYLPGATPTVVFLPGFASDMGGTKAMALQTLCAERGQAMLRLDYSGHGASGGNFNDGTIGIWTADAAAIMAHAVPSGPIILAGSSMGGWIALLLARMLGPRIAAMLLIAPAPDFSSELIEPNLTPDDRAALARDGAFSPPSQYGPPVPITAKLIEDGRRHTVLSAPIPILCPVRILQGMADPDVPWRHSLKLTEKLQSQDVQLTLIKHGDHRLSRDEDLRLLTQTLATLLGQNPS